MSDAATRSKERRDEAVALAKRILDVATVEDVDAVAFITACAAAQRAVQRALDIPSEDLHAIERYGRMIADAAVNDGRITLAAGTKYRRGG